MTEFVDVKGARSLLFGCSRHAFDEMRANDENFPAAYRMSEKGKLMFKQSEIIGYRETYLRVA